MRFKVDENLPAEVSESLRAAGHDALSVLDQKLGGRADQAIADIIRAEQRALITLDLDFADIRAFPPIEFAGIIVLRLAVQAKPNIIALVDRVIPLLNIEPLIGKLWVVDQTALRIRGEVT